MTKGGNRARATRSARLPETHSRVGEPERDHPRPRVRRPAVTAVGVDGIPDRPVTFDWTHPFTAVVGDHTLRQSVRLRDGLESLHPDGFYFELRDQRTQLGRQCSGRTRFPRPRRLRGSDTRFSRFALKGADWRGVARGADRRPFFASRGAMVAARRAGLPVIHSENPGEILMTTVPGGSGILRSCRERLMTSPSQVNPNKNTSHEQTIQSVPSPACHDHSRCGIPGSVRRRQGQRRAGALGQPGCTHAICRST